MMVTSWVFNEMMLSSLYFLAILSVFTILFIVILTYWNKINSLSRPSLAGQTMLDALPPPRTLSSAQEAVQETVNQTINQRDLSSKVVPVPLKTKQNRPFPKRTSQSQKEKPIFADMVEEALPMASTPFERSPQSIKKAWYAIKRVSGQFRILIVDDEPTNLQVLENQLTLHNYIVTQAISGEQALEMIYGGQQFDLVIVDVMMPLMSGYEVCRRLRQTFSPHQLPVIMLTAKDNVSDLVRGFESGANDYLSKPFSKEELLSRIQSHLLLSKINQAYFRFVPHEFIQMLGEESMVDIQLADQIQKEVTLLFSDIRSFTQISEQMSPKNNFIFLNDYLERMSPIIRRHEGFIHQYIGDAIMALFAGSVDHTIQAAIEMQHAVQEHNQQQIERRFPMIQIGIGLHHDRVMLGIIGEQERMETTIISPAVDIVMRLEELTKLYAASILITETTLNALEDLSDLEVRFVDKMKVKHSDKGLDIFEVLNAEPQDIMQLKLKTRFDFEQGLSFYQQKALGPAKACFERVLDTHPEDQAAWLYKQRVARSIRHNKRVEQNRGFKHL